MQQLINVQNDERNRTLNSFHVSFHIYMDHAMSHVIHTMITIKLVVLAYRWKWKEVLHIFTKGGMDPKELLLNSSNKIR